MQKNKLIKSKTYKNLQIAFAGESQARNKYTYYASVAKKEGYNEIAKFFIETADNEKEHAKIWFKLINKSKQTFNNLLDAAKGEHEEWTSMYKNFANEAKKEGFNDIAKLFTNVAEIEKVHENRFNQLANLLKEKRLFNRKKIVAWKCSNCGQIVYATSAPKICATCFHPQSYQEIMCNCNYQIDGCQCTIKRNKK